MSIVKTKFLCKNGSRMSPNGRLGIYSSQIVWEDRFIEGKWYDGEYETWSFEDGYRLNGGWRRYWIVNEKGQKEQIHKAHFKAIFETDIVELREEIIKIVLDDTDNKKNAI